MNILILGNGFDLAHGLSTRYTEFLSIVKHLLVEIDDSDKCYSDLAANLMRNFDERDLLDEFKCLLIDNVWFDYLTKRFERGSLIGINWIDFEAEIKQIVAHFEQAKTQNVNEYVVSFNIAYQDEKDYMEFMVDVVDKIRKQSDDSAAYLNELNPLVTIFSSQEYFAFSEYLFQQLRSLTRAFELYCVCLINRLNDDFIKDNKMIELDKQIREHKAIITKYESEF